MFHSMLRDPVLDSLFHAVRSGAFDRAVRGFGGASASATETPAINAWREEGHVVVEAEVPGYRMEDLDLEISRDGLVLRGERTVTAPEGATTLRQERAVVRRGAFERTLRLPDEVDLDAVRASLDHGVLRIVLPLHAAVRPRRIEIRPAGALPEGRPESTAGAEPIVTTD